MVVEKPEQIATKYLLICFFAAEIMLINIYSLLVYSDGFYKLRKVDVNSFS